MDVEVISMEFSKDELKLLAVLMEDYFCQTSNPDKQIIYAWNKMIDKRPDNFILGLYRKVQDKVNTVLED